MNRLGNFYHAIERLITKPQNIDVERVKYIVVRASLAPLVGSHIEQMIEVDTPEEAQSWIDHQPKPPADALEDYAIFESTQTLYKGNKRFWSQVTW